MEEHRPKEVQLSKAVNAVCQMHAMSSEREEVMGLLVGYLHEGCLMIVDCIQLPRNDKHPDRVEIASEQLVEAMHEVEGMKRWWPASLPEPRLVGWYHSHPHITVLPSAVDVCTQKRYEQMSSAWVGLIFGVFNRDVRRASDRYQLIAFMTNPDYDQQMVDVYSRHYSSDESEAAACAEIKQFVLLPISYSNEDYEPTQSSVASRMRNLPTVAKMEARQSLDQLDDINVRSSATLHHAIAYCNFINEHVRVNALPLYKKNRSKKKKEMVNL